MSSCCAGSPPINKLAKVIRIISIPPVMAAAFILVLFFGGKMGHDALRECIMLICFIGLAPASAYPISFAVPALRAKGRPAQRSLAIVTSNIGYISAASCAVIMNFSAVGKLIGFTYFYCGLFMLLFNGLLHIKASGHACGAAGPLMFLIYVYGISASICLLVYAVIFWASVAQRSHTPAEFITGSLIPAVSIPLALLTIGWLS